MSDVLEVLVVTGMSGAGRSTAARALEDEGWFVVDNLPPTLLDQMVATIANGTEITRLAVVVDVRAGGFFEELRSSLDLLRNTRGVDLRILFLEANDTVLVQRFEGNRRPHPLQAGERLVDGIRREREILSEVRESADLVIDTSTLNVHDLRRKVDAAFGDVDSIRLRATVLSFGFKYGIPVDADVVLDARFLPNPHWVAELQKQTGLDGPVNDYVVDSLAAREFLDRAAGLIGLAAEGYLREGKRYVTIAVGCTGGKHRSVAIAENLAARLVMDGVESLVVHRDLGRE